MRLSHFVASLALTANTVQAASLPDTNAVSISHAQAARIPRSSDVLAPENALEKRKGGGGGGGGGKGGGGGSSSEFLSAIYTLNL
jgi:hypothetical protein